MITSARSHNDNVITDPQDVTPEWLSGVLERNTGHECSAVREVYLILSRELQVSTVHRLAIRYENEIDAQPRSVFLKLCRPRDEAYLANICGAEVEFYLTLGGETASPPLIRVFDAAYDPTSGRSHLLMEDLTGSHSQHEQHASPPVEMSRMAVKALADVHARWWSSPQLGNGIGTVFDNEWLEKFIADLGSSISEFIGSCSRDLTDDQIDAYGLMLDAAPEIWGRLTDAGGLTVTHGDAHWWNFLYPHDPALDSVRIFDWQLWHIDLGARDLAFLLAMGGFAEPRPDLEDYFLGVYHDALIEYGVTGYSRKMLNEDYRWSAIRNLNLPVIFRRQGKHPTTWKTALERSFTAYTRMGCRDLL